MFTHEFQYYIKKPKPKTSAEFAEIGMYIYEPEPESEE